MAESVDATQFTRVDDARDTSFFVQFLDARTGIEGERQVKELEIAVLAVDPGACVLDVGCGTGDDAREIAGLVGPNGKVVGLDSSAAMVEESRKRASSSSLPVEFVQGDAYKLQFPDRSFDRTRADRVFVHLQDPERALDEMVRVLKPGGRVVVSDVDMGTCFIDSVHHETTRKVLNSFTDSLGSGWVGRSLPRMSRQAGLLDVECAPGVLRASLVFLHKLLDGHLADARVAGSFATGELALWWEDLTRAEGEGHLHWGFSVFTVVGRKP